MSLLKELVSLNRKPVKEMDFEFGGAKPQPEVTDGPMPNGDDGMDDYKDFKTDDSDDTESEYGDPLEGEDSLECDVPFLIKLLEWAHEEAQSDEEIHTVVENMLALDKSPITMDDYESIIPESQDEMGGDEIGDEQDLGAPEGGDDYPEGDAPLRNGDTTQNNSDKVFRMK